MNFEGMHSVHNTWPEEIKVANGVTRFAATSFADRVGS